MLKDSRSLDSLIHTLRVQVVIVLEECASAGVIMVPYRCAGSPQTQAKLWRQSRTTKEIVQALTLLRDRGAPWLADVLEAAGPQYGRKVTDAMPGFSRHNWLSAVDCYWDVDGRAEWSSRRMVNGLNGYQLYRTIAIKRGLARGPLNDFPHIQSLITPGLARPWSSIDADMKGMWSE